MNPEDRIFNRAISDSSVVQRETTLAISDSIYTGSPVEIEIVRVVSLCTTELSEITRLKIRSSGFGYLKRYRKVTETIRLKKNVFRVMIP